MSPPAAIWRPFLDYCRAHFGAPGSFAIVLSILLHFAAEGDGHRAGKCRRGV
jgi:hypothetical protein